MVSGWMGGRDPHQQSWPTVTHRLNEPGMLPPDALWPRLRDTGRAIISVIFSLSLTMRQAASMKPSPPYHHRQQDGCCSLNMTHSSAWLLQQWLRQRQKKTAELSVYQTRDAFIDTHSSLQWDTADGAHHWSCVKLGVIWNVALQALHWLPSFNTNAT